MEGGKSITAMNSIARVFPRKTKASPIDPLAFFGAPTIENIADCIKANVKQVHISVTFTWDIETAEELYYAWQVLGVPVEVGGPAFDDRMGDFTPGMYLRDGYIFTSRGCTKECWFCSVPRCSHGQIKELPIVDGWNILDDNILGTSERHFLAVCEMLKRQAHPAIFTGGLEPALLQQWQADLLREVKPARIYTAYDILRGENTSLLDTIRQIEEAYDEMEADGFYDWKDSTKRFDRLLAALPDRAWLE